MSQLRQSYRTNEKRRITASCSTHIPAEGAPPRPRFSRAPAQPITFSRSSPGMTRHLLHLAGIALCILLPATQALAVGMGEITLHSRLSQPLSATIPILGVSTDEEASISVALATPEAFEQAGLPWLPLYRSIDLQVTTAQDGKPVIRLSSPTAVHEPILQLLLKLTAPEETLLKTYTLLLDPPLPASQGVGTAERRKPAPRSGSSADAAPGGDAPGDLAKSPRAQLIEKGLLRGNLYGPVRDGDRISLIAQRVRQDPSISLNQLMLSILEANPDAFEQGNLNRLKRGAMLRLPPEQEALKIDKRQAARLVLDHSLNRPSPPVPPPRRPPAEEHRPEAPAHRTEAHTGPTPVLQITEPPAPAPLAAPAPEPPPSAYDTAGAPTSPDHSLQGVQAALDSLQEQFEKTKQLLILQTDLIEAAERAKQARARADSDLKRALEQQSKRLHTLEQQLQNLKAAPTAGQLLDAAWERYKTLILVGLTLLLLFALGIGWRLARRPGAAPMPAPPSAPKAAHARSTLHAPQRSSGHPGLDDRQMDLEYPEERSASTTARTPGPSADDDSPLHTGQPKPGKSSQIGDINLKEIDVRLSYGRFSQCVEMLERAMVRQPNVPELMLKMLETHARARDSEAFAARAAEYRAQLSERDWEHVLSMARSLGLDESRLSPAPHRPSATD